MAPVTLLIVGAGSRGSAYADYAHAHPDAVRVVGVAESRERWRSRVAATHAIPANRAVEDWRALAEGPRCADAVVIATPDALHLAPAIAFAERGYHILLEKPMAPTAAGCRQIVAAVRRAGVILAVAHVLRYTRYTQRLKELLDAGRVGEVVSVQHLEPVGYWHQAHSFVRGNWRSEAESSPMLLAKACHDLDWLRFVVGQPCVSVASFGGLHHFRPAAAPAGAASRCLDCAIEPSCPYSAPRIYGGFLERGDAEWLLQVITPDPSPAGLREALRSGPYGRCVYACDNDVVDHQVVSMQFAGGASASFTMTAFTRPRGRETRIFGTRGELAGDGAAIAVYDFLSGRTEHIVATEPELLGGHAGGDDELMRRFVAAVAAGDANQIASGPEETLESHLIVFAAEVARREGRVVHLGEEPAHR